MQAAGGEAEDDVARGDVGAGEQPVALDRADGEAGEIVVALGIEPGHLRRLAADQRATGLPAALGDAGDDGPAVLDLQPPRREIVEEEQRLARPARRGR